MTTEIATLGYRVLDDELVRAERRLANFITANERAQQATLKTEQQQARTNQAMANAQAATSRAAQAKLQLANAQARATGTSQSFGNSLQGLSGHLNAVTMPMRQLQLLFTATFGAAIVKQTIDMADGYTNLQARLELVTGSAEEARVTMQRLFEVSQNNRQSFQETGNLFARIGLSMKDLGVNTGDTIKVVDTLQKAIVIGGTSAQEASAGLRQMAQALGSGKLSGDEFRSMMENLPGVARVLADALGVPIGALKRMAADGKLTTDILLEAFILMNDKVKDQFAKMPLTVGQAMEQVQNAVFKAVGEINQQIGATTVVAEFLSGMARGIEGLSPALRQMSTDLSAIGDASGFVRSGVDLLATMRDALGLTGAEIGSFGDHMSKVWAGTKTDLENLGRIFSVVFDGIASVVRSTKKEIDAILALWDKVRNIKLPSLTDVGQGAVDLLMRPPTGKVPKPLPPGLMPDPDMFLGGVGDYEIQGGAGSDLLGNSTDERLANLRQRVQGSGISSQASRALDRLTDQANSSGLSGYAAQVNKLNDALQDLAANLGDDEASMRALAQASASGEKILEQYVATQRKQQQQAAEGQRVIVEATREQGVVFDELSQRYEVNERAVMVARKQHELMTNESLPMQAAAARQAAEAWAENEIAIRKNTDAANATAAAMNALFVVQRETSQLTQQVDVVRQLTIEYDHQANQFRINDRELKVLQKTQELMQASSKMDAAAARAAAEGYVDQQIALEKLTQAQQRAVDMRNRLLATQQDTAMDALRTNALRNATVEWNELTHSYELNTRELDILNKTLELTNNGTLPHNQEEVRKTAEAWVDAQAEFKKVDDERRKVIRDQERWGDVLLEPFKNMARNMQSLFADTFEDILNGGVNSFEELAERAGQLFNRMQAEMMSSVIMQPIMKQMEALNSSGSFLGLGGGAWGALGMVGGNMGLNALLPNRNTSFTGIGSMIGGLAGSAFGPLGMIGGSLLGNLAGGLFGGKKSSGPAGRANLMLQNGEFALGSAAGDNGGDISGIVNDVQQAAKLLNAFKSQYGLSAVGSGWVGALGFGKAGGFVNASPEEMVAGALKTLRGTGTVGTILANTRQTSIEGIASDLDFAKIYDEMIKIQPVLSDTERAIETLKNQFHDAMRRAVDLGLSVHALDAAMHATLKRMRDEFNKGVQDAILGILDPDAAEMKALTDMQERRRKDAIALGADLLEIDRLSGLERKKLLEKQQAEEKAAQEAALAALKASFEGVRRLIDDMTLGPLAPLSAADRLTAIQGKYSGVEAAALGGDMQARAEFDAIARQYLDIARENYASGAGFQAIYEQVLTAAQSILGQAPGGIGSANDNVVAELQANRAQAANDNELLREQVAHMAEEIARLNSNLSQLMAGQGGRGGR